MKIKILFAGLPISAFESVTVSPEVLDKNVGVDSIPGVPVKFAVTHDDATLFIQMPGNPLARSKRWRRINLESKVRG